VRVANELTYGYNFLQGRNLFTNDIRSKDLEFLQMNLHMVITFYKDGIFLPMISGLKKILEFRWFDFGPFLSDYNVAFLTL